MILPQIQVTSESIQKARKHACRNRALNACKECKQLKIKCSDAKPCKFCRLNSKTCIISNPSPKFLNNEWVIPPTSWIIPNEKALRFTLFSSTYAVYESI